MSAGHRAMIEAGPVTIRRLCCGAAESTDAAAVLEWIDDSFGLVDGQPFSVPELLRDALACAGLVESMEVIHPSWWPDRRVALLMAAARGCTGDVVTRSRSTVLAAEFQAAVTVEIGAELVAVTAGAEVGAEPRIGSPGGVADAVAARVYAALRDRRAAVVIDAPARVGGAAALAAMIDRRLRPETPVIVVDELPPISRAADTPAAAPVRAGRRLRLAPAVAAVGVLALALLVHRDAAPDTMGPTYLLEGRVAVQVPADWLVRRVTGGPGSARAEVVSPTDPQRILHLTQAPAVGDTLAAVAEPLQRALELADVETPGVFVGFDPAGASAGRPAVTYREIRDGHQVDWVVLVDRAVRIGIGCQSGPGGEDALRAVCEQAVRSAHAVR